MENATRADRRGDQQQQSELNHPAAAQMQGARHDSGGVSQFRRFTVKHFAVGFLIAVPHQK